MTASLRLERPRDEHATHYEELFTDPVVAATLWPGDLGGPRTPEQAHALHAEDLAHWEVAGFGPWVAFERGPGRFVGRGGLERTTVGGAEGVEILYALVPDAWGRGYATEIAVAAAQRADELRLEEVVGFTLTTNVASQRVLQKAGIGFERVIEHAGRPHWFGRLAIRETP
jgi:[ribosomal protein S5]-alanine N-acetyltransferase